MTLPETIMTIFILLLCFALLGLLLWATLLGITFPKKEKYNWVAEHLAIPNEYQNRPYYWPEVVARRKAKNGEIEEVEILEEIVMEEVGEWDEIVNGVRVTGTN